MSQETKVLQPKHKDWTCIRLYKDFEDANRLRNRLKQENLTCKIRLREDGFRVVILREQVNQGRGFMSQWGYM